MQRCRSRCFSFGRKSSKSRCPGSGSCKRRRRPKANSRALGDPGCSSKVESRLALFFNDIDEQHFTEKVRAELELGSDRFAWEVGGGVLNNMPHHHVVDLDVYVQVGAEPGDRAPPAAARLQFVQSLGATSIVAQTPAKVGL